MPTPFSENLRLVLKMLSMSGTRLASELAIDKSVISRWLRGSAKPTAYNLSRLSDLVARRVDGFKVLDWERDRRSLAKMFGADPNAIPSFNAGLPAPGLPIAIWEQMIAAASARGKAYEGFFRSTRPHPRNPGRFVHEYGMIRRDPIGLLRLTMGSAESAVDGWMIPLHGQVFSIAADTRNGALAFGIFNGIGTTQVDAFDGLTLIPASDMGRGPLATGILCERIGDLSDDREADDERCRELMTRNPLAPEGSIPEHICRHLVQDIGPEQLARGGDWLLSMSLARSLVSGPNYDSASKLADGPIGTASR